MFCSKCGQELKDTDKFCPTCGHVTKTLIEKTSKKDENIYLAIGLIIVEVFLFIITLVINLTGALVLLVPMLVCLGLSIAGKAKHKTYRIREYYSFGIILFVAWVVLVIVKIVSLFIYIF